MLEVRGDMVTELSIGKFPAGETNLRIVKDDLVSKVFTIVLNYESNDDLINLALLTDALRNRFPDIPLVLDMPYFPYARQDRLCNPGEARSLKVIAKFINSLGFSKVKVFDPHSDVTENLVENIEVETINETIVKILYSGYAFHLVSPDAGALKKVERAAKYCGVSRIIKAEKHRDTATGAITKTTVHTDGHLDDTDLLVVDDICDGGATFLALGKELRKVTDGKLKLYVSHGIFSKELDELAKIYDTIYCHNLMNKAVKGHPKLRIV